MLTHTLTEIDLALYFLCLISFVIFPLLCCFLISYLLHEYGMIGERSWSVEWAKQVACKGKKKKKKKKKKICQVDEGTGEGLWTERSPARQPLCKQGTGIR
jgi:hypothetical protein